jgi:hypothetical protein
MRLEKEAYVIVGLVGIVLLPMWAIALASGEAGHAVTLVQGTGTIVPTETFLPTPHLVNENVAGVITWIALFGIVGTILYTHRFIHRIGQAPESVATDGGLPVDVPSYLTAGGRRIVEYWPARADRAGVVAVALFSWSTVTFAALLLWEGLHLARTQFLGVYAGMMLLSLGVTVAVYASWFLPSVQVAEPRGHERKLTEDTHD